MGNLFQNLSGASAAKTEAKSVQNLANFQAEVKIQEAKGIRARSGVKGRQQAKAAVARKGATIASIAVAGGLESPVAGDILAEQAANEEFNQLISSFEAESLARRSEEQAKLDRLGGQLAKQRGKNLATARNIQLATTIATAGAETKTGKTLLTGF